MEKTYAVILAAGSFPNLEHLGTTPYLCCCDSAAMTALEHGLMPDAVVGDGDSLTPEQKVLFGSRYHEVSEQADNDLTKATRHCIAQGYSTIYYYGATGKRESHTIGNFSLMVRYAREFHITPILVTDYGTLRVYHGNQTFQVQKGSQISIFNFGCTHLASQGLKWDVYPFTELWQGTLNEALSNNFSIEADFWYAVFVEVTL